MTANHGSPELPEYPVSAGGTSIKRLVTVLFVLTAVLSMLYVVSGPMLTVAGQWLVLDETPAPSDAVVVLTTGVDYFPRLMAAAEIYREEHAPKVVIDGNRKTDVLRGLEAKGFVPCCPWYEDSVRILGILGVPEKDVVPISAEDAYDTVSEAEIVGGELVRRGFKRVIVATSKSHTRRAAFIWRDMFKGQLTVCVLAAAADPYDPAGWWKQGRQIRWVLAEYGAWVYYWWKRAST